MSTTHEFTFQKLNICNYMHQTFFLGIKMYTQKLLSHIKTEITLAQTSNISNIPEH